jgi:replication factor C large subunit
MQLWTEKYRPKRLKEVLGQEEAVRKIVNFIMDYSRKKGKKALMIYGPVGSGKSSAVYALASEMNYEVLELNASDFRDSMQISRIAGEAIGQRSLFANKKIIMIDEIEGISGYQDKGGIGQIEKLIMDSYYPIILISNKPFDQKFSKLRKNCEMIEFKKLDYLSVARVLQKICENENLKIEPLVLRKIALDSKGDVRAAVNDLSVGGIGQEFITQHEMESIGKRDKEETIFNALRKIFKSSATEALNALNNVDADLNECILWIEENIPVEYEGKDIEKAFDMLSKADVFRGRIIRKQNWRFLNYVSALATAGVASAKSKTNSQFVLYRKVSRILKIWIAKQKQMVKKEIAAKFAVFTHTSKKRALQEMPLFGFIYRKSDNPEQINRDLKLNEKEIEYLQAIPQNIQK